MRIAVAVEDDLSGAVAKRLIGEYVQGGEVSKVLVAGGSLKGRIAGPNQIARHIEPILALADLDRPQGCPAALIQELARGLTISPAMLIRIAVLEIESWIMADQEGLAKCLSISPRAIPHNPEEVVDPKRALTRLAANSRNRAVREGIAPRPVLGTHRVGPAYNIMLGEFVEGRWNPEAARRNSPSLNRSILRIASLAAS